MISDPVKFSQLAPSRQALVRLCQYLNFGWIHSLRLQGGNPVFEPCSTVVFDEKLDSDKEQRAELELSDFVLPAELRRLMARLDQIGDGTIERLEVRDGVPRRMIFESSLAAILPLDTKT